MNDPLFSVADQVVVVSGGSRGIGYALAAGFATRGATVVILGRERATLEQAAAEMSAGDGAANGKRSETGAASAGDSQPAATPVQAVVCDVADPAAIQAAVAAILTEHGRIDTLLNVAGVNRRLPAEQLTLADYDFVLDINLRGAFVLSQEVGRDMLRRGSGNQINITSLNNERPLLNVLPYAVSKAGLGQLTRALACEWGPRGIRVNAIAPGFILTDLTRKLWSQETMHTWGRANTPLGRMGEPEDLVGAAIFLASPAARFVTGQILYVDGGFTAGYQWPIQALSAADST